MHRTSRRELYASRRHFAPQHVAVDAGKSPSRVLFEASVEFHIALDVSSHLTRWYNAIINREGVFSSRNDPRKFFTPVAAEG